MVVTLDPCPGQGLQGAHGVTVVVTHASVTVYTATVGSLTQKKTHTLFNMCGYEYAHVCTHTHEHTHQLL